MPVVKVGNVLPKRTRFLKQSFAINQQNNEHKVINSFEFQAGFVPKTTPNNPIKVQHFINQLI